MKIREEAMLKALLVRSPHHRELVRFFSPRISQKLQESLPPSATDLSKLFSSTKWLSAIHYSWFYLPLGQMPKESRPLFISCLPPTHVKGLSLLFKEELKGLPLSRFATLFLLDHLKKKVQEKEILEEPLLPFSKMNVLLRLPKTALIDVINLLGVFDLAAELRHVVDKELLAKIHASLSQQQLQFLTYASQQTMKWVPPKLNLSQWDGSPQQLTRLVHQRGLIRLAKAIVNEHESFRWHLLHRLDTGRALIILKTFNQKQDKLLTPYFKEQALLIIKRHQI